MLYYFPQIWASDDTDALERCRIQCGTSYAYPPSCISAHVSDVPNHKSLRTVSMQTRGIVAMGGILGYELDLAQGPAGRSGRPSAARSHFTRKTRI